jgi:hypothetical protein
VGELLAEGWRTVAVTDDLGPDVRDDALAKVKSSKSVTPGIVGALRIPTPQAGS